jgi:hypothetical protein
VHLGRVLLENIKSMPALDWNRESDADLAGWHVVLGGNGAGKSTLLRAIALGLSGPQGAAALRIDPTLVLRTGAEHGQVTVTARASPWDIYSGSGARHSGWLVATLDFQRNGERVEIAGREGADRHLWGSGEGWFSASYGPFRRFQGGDKDLEKLYYSYPKVARHLTLFGENVALSECTDWLKHLKFRELENQRAGDPGGGKEGRLLGKLLAFINQSQLLPHGATMAEVGADGVFFNDGAGTRVSVEELSDGYRSVLSMTFELLRQLEQTWLNASLFNEKLEIEAPGVVLIDEVDVHLHPAWQRDIGRWFTSRFPNFQFIVTTHSPLICQSAVKGSIFRLPVPGSDDVPRFIEGLERDRLLYGNVVDAYSGLGFGRVPTRSDEGMAKLERLAELEDKALDADLDDEERAERERLLQMFPTG